jgi:hypothetical protein
MKKTKVLIKNVTLWRATILVKQTKRSKSKLELWRDAWSSDPMMDTFHPPLRLDTFHSLTMYSGRLMAVSCGGHHWDSYSMTVDDILARDWRVLYIVSE